jgi:hypothetical protein
VSNLLKITSVVVFIAALLIVQFQLNGANVTFAMPDENELQSTDWLLLGAQALLLLFGIMFGYFHRRFTLLRDGGVNTVNIFMEFRGMFSATRFYLALFAAPIVFGVILVATEGMAFMPALLVAFQNGFFCEKVMPEQPQAAQLV